ncbi:amidohydrolase family protein [Pseudomonas sp. DTU_2021_1001937_2_SI_NGA_ILE_001]|uniref:amidohydrolase family protein n=1 Tax=Pseudomonas sp. DTU_2021_1001937_2_SI_NGA_ILE_001 TaxID=3077589 RepID=UPI0028FC1C4F|nr:amidohydrolase family protein [Pseudomonas sp. DTU_2021_1001937_2_SI_NGA_ILE_001]WNW10220.1 amidohydrolase family protein [Pseudomonas sp. DTU_2021_1001937_2_SI_NGA_ILE_001]
MTTIQSLPFSGIDAHAHVFDHRLQMVQARRYAPNADATLDDYLAQLDAHGMSHGVLVQPSFLGTDNSYLLDALEQNLDRLRGVVVIDPHTPLETLVHMASLGVRGMRLNLVGQTLPDLRQPAWQACLEMVNALGWHVELHRQLADLPALIETLLAAGCKVVVDHFGRADARLGLDQPGMRELLELGRGGQLWVKVSALYRLGGTAQQQTDFAAQALAALSDHLGARRLLWGSDWPHTQHEAQARFGDELDRLRQLAAAQGILPQVLRESAAELFAI